MLGEPKRLDLVALHRRVHEKITGTIYFGDYYHCSERADWDLFRARARLQLLALELKVTLPRPYLPTERHTKPKPRRLKAELKGFEDLYFSPQDMVIRAIEDGALPLLQRLLSGTGDLPVLAKQLEGSVGLEGFGHTNFTPLQHAARLRRKDCVKWLLSQGVDASARSRDGRGITALMLAAEQGDEQLTAMLLDAGADSNATSEEDLTAVAFAVANSHLDVLQVLFQHDANIPRDGHAVRRILYKPILRERLDIIKAIRERGADFKKCGELLALAASNGSVELVTHILREGINANSDSRFGNALIMASASGHVETVRVLLEGGADPNVVGMGGKAALELAKQINHPQVAKLLRDFARRRAKQK